jgi:predicted RND superfamily exporter protein
MGEKSRFEKGVTRYAEGLIRWRWPVVLGTLLLVAAAGAGIRHLGLATNYRVFFGADNPDLAAFEAVQNIYTKNDSILFVVTPADGEVFRRETLAALEELTERAWQIPYSIRVDSVTNFQHSEAEGDDLIVENLVEGAALLSDAELAEIERIARSRPELVGRLLPAADAPATTTGVNVTLQLPGEDPMELFEPVGMARQIAADLEAEHPGLEVRLTGVSMLNSAFVESGLRDMQRLIPVMYLVLIVTMVLLLRSVSSTVATFLVIGLSAATAMGLAGWYRTLLEPVSSQATTMILTMAIADSIHILLGMLAEMRRGRAKRPAIVESLRVNFLPVFLTSLTTAIGFLSMNFSDSPPLNRLGTITAVGVTAAFLLSVSFLPALVAILPVRTKQEKGSAGTVPGGRRDTALARLASLVTARYRTVLVASTAAALLLVALVPLNEVSDKFVEYFDESIDFRRDSDFALANLTGLYQMQYSLESSEPGGISEPTYLAKLDEFANWMRQQPEVVHVATLSDTMRRLNMNMHADDPSEYRLPESRELAAQYLLLYEMSLPYGLDLNNTINVDKSSTRLVTTAGDVATREFLALADRSERWLEANAPEWRGTDPERPKARPTGPAVMFSRITERNIESMVIGTAFAFLLISAVLVLALRSVKIGLLSLVPNLIPAAAAFGAWGLLVGQVGFAVSVVAAMTMGIVVDDSVHFLSKYLRARREKGLEAPEAVRYAFDSVGRALWVTSAVLVAGFVILAQSTFKQNADMGLLAAVTIVFALAADFVLLPALLLLVDGKRAHLEAAARQAGGRLVPAASRATDSTPRPVPVPIDNSFRTEGEQR